MCVFGTRPEAIKLAPIIKELYKHPDQIETRVCVTAQHREMLDQVLTLFGIRPDYDLNIMKGNQTPTQVASAVLAQLEPVLKAESPDWVLVQGDTTTVAAASFASFYAQVKVGHVEAGLRTWNKHHPFPEEINRRLASVIADLHFAPTELSRSNLLREGIPEETIIVTGNPVIDALHWVNTKPVDETELTAGVFNLKQLLKSCEGKKLILVTAHRRENFGQPLENICHALLDLAVQYQDKVRIIYPVHMNPNIWDTAHRLLGNTANIILTPPLDYLPLIRVMTQAYLVLTDSGGIQEEAPGLGIPVLVLRETTERPEAVEAGTVRLVGTDRERILFETSHLLEGREEYEKMARAINPYGDGHASERIVSSLLGETITPFELTSLQRTSG